MLGQQPILILKEGTQTQKGKSAQFNNIIAARGISDAVKSTLGPRGMDKMLVNASGDVVITNDGATILREIDVEHPVAKMMVEVAKSQDEECGDGTTTAVILTGELLKYAGELLEQDIHPTVITQGFKLAAEKAVETLNLLATPLKSNDSRTLSYIAKTAIAGKGATSIREKLTDIAVQAVNSIVEKVNGKTVVDIDNIVIQKKHGSSMNDTAIIKGIILNKERAYEEMPKLIKNAKIGLVNTAFEVKKTEVDAKIQIRDPRQLQAFLDEEERMLKKMVNVIKKSGANVLICQKSIDDLAQHYLAKEKVYAVQSVKESDVEKLARATGAQVIVNLDDLSERDLGYAGVVEEKKIGDDRMTFVSECKHPKAVSILLRGGTEHVVDELERALHDALFVVKMALEDGMITPGGGGSATEVAMMLRGFAPTVGGREHMAIEAFADALEVVPKTLAENAGLDPIDMMIEMRRTHKKGNKFTGIDIVEGKVSDMRKQHVIEPLRVSIHEIQSATEAATMILRIDNVIAAKSSFSGVPTGSSIGGEDFEE
jgi:thermosome